VFCWWHVTGTIHIFLFGLTLIGTFLVFVIYPINVIDVSVTDTYCSFSQTFVDILSFSQFYSGWQRMPNYKNGCTQFIRKSSLLQWDRAFKQFMNIAGRRSRKRGFGDCVRNSLEYVSGSAV